MANVQNIQEKVIVPLVNAQEQNAVLKPELKPADQKAAEVAPKVIQNIDAQAKGNCCSRLWTKFVKFLKERIFCCFFRSVKKQEPDVKVVKVPVADINKAIDDAEWLMKANKYCDGIKNDEIVKDRQELTKFFIEGTLKQPEFKENPKAYIEKMRESRGGSEEWRVGADESLQFFEKELGIQARAKQNAEDNKEAKPPIQDVSQNIVNEKKQDEQNPENGAKPEDKPAEQNGAKPEEKPADQKVEEKPAEKNQDGSEAQKKEEKAPIESQVAAPIQNAAQPQQPQSKPAEQGNPPTKRNSAAPTNVQFKQAVNNARQSSEMNKPLEPRKVPTPPPQGNKPINLDQSPASTKQAPVKQAPVKQAPIKQAPVKQAPIKQAPVKQAPTNAQEPPVKQVGKVKISNDLANLFGVPPQGNDKKVPQEVPLPTGEPLPSPKPQKIDAKFSNEKEVLYKGGKIDKNKFDNLLKIPTVAKETPQPQQAQVNEPQILDPNAPAPPPPPPVQK